jgi:probable addiction module antidote protein
MPEEKFALPRSPPITSKTEEDIAASSPKAVAEDGGDDPAYIARARGVVTHARNMTALVREVGMSRVGLNKALSGAGNPDASTVMKAAKALRAGSVSIQPGA